MELTIDKLGGLGDGLVHQDGMLYLVPKTCAGDRVRVEFTRKQKDLTHAKLVELLAPGPDRLSAPCPYFDACGGCQIQHISAQAYTAFKTGIAQNAIRKAGYNPALLQPMLPMPVASRRRAELRIEGSRIGYFEAQSHRLTSIDQCLILAKPLQQWLAAFHALLPDYNWDNQIEGVAVTLTDSGIDMLLELTGKPALERLEQLAEILHVARLCYRLGPQITTVAERRPVTIQVGKASIPLKPGMFLQASRESQQAITQEVLKGLEGARRIIDLFSGIGTYSFPAADKAKLHAVEGDAGMVKAIQTAAKALGWQSRITAETRDLFRTPVPPHQLKTYDAAIINPPRAGAKAQAEMLAKAKLPRLIMVSCNPASFARDAAILREGGYQLTTALPVDQFVYSSHLEIIAAFRHTGAS